MCGGCRQGADLLRHDELHVGAGHAGDHTTEQRRAHLLRRRQRAVLPAGDGLLDHAAQVELQPREAAHVHARDPEASVAVGEFEGFERVDLLLRADLEVQLRLVDADLDHARRDAQALYGKRSRGPLSALGRVLATGSRWAGRRFRPDRQRQRQAGGGGGVLAAAGARCEQRGAASDGKTRRLLAPCSRWSSAAAAHPSHYLLPPFGAEIVAAGWAVWRWSCSGAEALTAPQA